MDIKPFLCWFSGLETARKWTFITILVSIIYGVFLFAKYLNIKREFKADCQDEEFQSRKRQILNSVIACIFLVVVLITSYNEFFDQQKRVIPDGRTEQIWYLTLPSILFLVIVFIKLLLISLSLMLFLNIIKSDRLLEIGAKFFGFELHQKFSSNAEKLIEKVSNQFDFAGEISKLSIQLIAEDSLEADLIDSEDVYEEIREKIRGLLGKVYYDSKVKYYIIPGTGEGFQQLDDSLVKIIKNLYNKDRQSGSGDLAIPNPKIGYGSVLLEGGNTDTIIVIDTKRAGYSVTVAEIAGVTMLYYTLIYTAYWLSRNEAGETEVTGEDAPEGEIGNGQDN